jgi:hypothetical protein
MDALGLYKKNLLTFMFIFVCGTFFLLPSLGYDKWRIVESKYYENWQIRYDRVVIARLVKTREAGFLSSGGLLGLGDVQNWDWNTETNRHQYDVYLNGENFKSYLPYKSHPGFQGIVFGTFDQFANFPGTQNLKIFRGSVALASAIILALFSAGVAVEFGWLAGIFILLFSLFSEWTILPAGSIYWNLWAFYLPFVTSIFLLADATKKNSYNTTKIHWAIFIATLLKILFNGFELITTVLVMTTVPFVFYAIYNKWKWKVFISRITKTGGILMAATVTGLFILSLQIAANDGAFSSSIYYVLSTFDRRAIGDPEVLRILSRGTDVTILSVIKTYLGINAFNTQTLPSIWQVPYWKLVCLFALFTGVFIVRFKLGIRSSSSQKGVALVITTWYSLAAPLSWFIIFKPASFIHPHLFPMAWQMPFVLLGFALCGFVIQDLFKIKTS